jgi:hypothetical protein
LNVSPYPKRLKETILWTIGIVAMIILGYITAFGSQDLVWLLVPGIALVIGIFGLSKILR